MAKFNDHHIEYEPDEWIATIKAQDHRTITSWQKTKATPEQYMYLTSFIHALMYEWNRIRKELDTGKDLRVKKPKEDK